MQKLEVRFVLKGHGLRLFTALFIKSSRTYLSTLLIQAKYHVVDTGSFGWQQFGSLPALILEEQSNSSTPNRN